MMMLCFTEAGWGQTSLGPLYPGTGANIEGPGTESWTNPGFITAYDSDSAIVILPNTETSSFTSEYLQGTNYGFSIPAGSAINGIQVRIMRKSSHYNPDGVGIYDASLNLLKNGIITGDNYASTAIWSTDMTEVLYGDASDLWGTTWSAEDINNSNFGIAFSVTQNGTGGREAFIDYIAITVTFTAPPPTVFPNFPGTGANVDGPGTEAWTNTGYITADDVNYAYVVLPNTETSTFTSDYLQGNNYGFSVPSGAVINGIEVKIMRQSSSYNPDGVGIYDASLNLLRDGVISGADYGDEAIWSESFTEVTYGGEYDLWGTTWTAQDINNPDFGVSFSVTQNGTGGRIAYVDYITVIVYFTITPPTITPNSPGTGANVDGPGAQPWINPEYITAEDENLAYTNLPNTQTETYTSEYLQGSNYSFAIPAGSSISGIEVKIIRRSSHYNPDGIGVYDASLNLLKNSVITGDNRASSAIWSETLTEITYGSQFDLWGTTWTADEINNPNFGVSFSVTQNGTGGRIAYVDHIAVIVYYTSVPWLTTNPSNLNFGFITSGDISPEQTFQLSGTNLAFYSGSITITSPSTDFQVSNDNINWGAITNLAYDSYTLPATDIYVRFTPQTTGLKSGNITISGGGVVMPPTVALTGTGVAPPASGDYRSAVETGIWGSPDTWEIFSGTGWIAATNSPTSADNIITIRNGHNILVASGVTVDQVVVENGGQVLLPANIVLTIADDPIGDDFVVYGTLSRTTGTITTTGTLVFANGGTYNHAQDGGSIPTATWDTNSLCNITSVSFTTPAGLNPAGGFGNFTWNCSGQLINISLASDMTVKGNFTISNTANYGLFMSSSSTPYSIVVAGSFNIVNPATFKMNNGAGSCTLNIGGDLNITGNTSGTTGFYLNSFNGTANAIVNVTGNVNISSGCLRFSDDGGSGAVATLNLTGDFNHNGGFVQNTQPGGTFLGTVNFTGPEMQTFNSSGITANHVINLNANNGAYLQMGTPGTIVTGSGTFTLQNGSTLGITSPAGITASGAAGNIQTTGRSFSPDASYIYNGTGTQNTGDGLPPTVSNLTFDNSGGVVTFDGARTITNNFSITAGSKANLGNGLSHITSLLTFSGIEQAGGGSWGHSISPATFKNDTYFDEATGIVNNQVNTWLGGTTDWFSASNWSGGTPGSGSSAIIPMNASNQPVIAGASAAICDRLTINPGASLTFNTSGRANITEIRNNGTLNLESDGTGIASLILDSYIDNGIENIQIFLTGGGDESSYPWHYISSPVAGLSTDITVRNETASYDLAAYDETLIAAEHHLRWIGYDGWDYIAGDYGAAGFGQFEIGRGYNYYNYLTETRNFGGDLNTDDVSRQLSFTESSFGDDTKGWNLLGNPFSSGLDWDAITKPTGIDNAIYFTVNNTLASYVNGVSNNGATGLIPPMQGFFVKANQSGISLTLPVSARVHNFHSRYKGEAGTIPLIRLKIENNTRSDETVIRFDEKANITYDSEFDAYKFSKTGTYVSLWTTTGTVSYSINGIPFPEKETEIPVGLNISEPGSFKLTASQLQGIENYSVFLTDKTTGLTINLKSNPSLSFTSSEGMISDRFVIKVTNISTDIESSEISETIFNIYSSNDFINIQTLSDEWDGKTGSIDLIDITGKTILKNNNLEFWKNSLIQIPATGFKGIYFVKVQSGLMRFVGKVMIR